MPIYLARHSSCLISADHIPEIQETRHHLPEAPPGLEEISGVLDLLPRPPANNDQRAKVKRDDEPVNDMKSVEVHLRSSDSDGVRGNNSET